MALLTRFIGGGNDGAYGIDYDGQNETTRYAYGQVGFDARQHSLQTREHTYLI